jgi:aspartate carbamoyltransferase catalytic subunit
MAYGLARLGAKVTMASPKKNRTPESVMAKLDTENGNVEEVFDLDQDKFNELISDMDLVYLPGCSAPKGPESEEFKKLMDDFYVRFDTLDIKRQVGSSELHIRFPDGQARWIKKSTPPCINNTLKRSRIVFRFAWHLL